MNILKIMLLSLLIPSAIVSQEKKPFRLPRPFPRPISQPFAEAKQAILTGNVEKIRTLLRTNPDILKQTDNVGQTLLTWNIITGIRDITPINLTIFNLLLDSGISTKNPNYLTLLTSEAGREGSLEAMRLLIEKGADINGLNSNKMTPLITAAQAGNLEAVKLLLRYGSARSASDLRRTQGSYLSLFPKELSKMVAQYGINPNIKDNEGKTALDHAIQGYDFNDKSSKNEWYLTKAYPNKTRKEMVDLVESQKKNYQEIIDLLKPITKTVNKRT